MARGEGGQATVELALCLPFVALLIGAFVEVGFWVGDRARVIHAAREAARIAAVDPDEDHIRRAAERTGLTGASVEISPDTSARVVGDPIEVTVTYRPAPRVPLAGSIFRPGELEASAVMRIETP
jgi:Flp pilus assembly protein TadG